ncbi:hypothetical protein PIB30_105276 [Stylosanthes scabra]|uniref:Uncharacterized protein n=1 Tax=Stylosanthes scabra TaxID=79078 RepID=A0ABU6ZXK3_9FABA|nr:hypothetical protein [Stylosanthes scabra]
MDNLLDHDIPSFVSWAQRCCRNNLALFAAGLWWVWRDRNNDIFCPNEPWNNDFVLALCRKSSSELIVIEAFLLMVILRVLVVFFEIVKDNGFAVFLVLLVRLWLFTLNFCYMAWSILDLGEWRAASNQQNLVIWDNPFADLEHLVQQEMPLSP